MSAVPSMYVNRESHAVKIANQNHLNWSIQQGFLNYYSKQFNILTYRSNKLTGSVNVYGVFNGGAHYPVVFQVLDPSSNILETVEVEPEDANRTYEELKSKYILDHDRVLN
jgi:hypothetical protein